MFIRKKVRQSNVVIGQITSKRSGKYKILRRKDEDDLRKMGVSKDGKEDFITRQPSS